MGDALLSIDTFVTEKSRPGFREMLCGDTKEYPLGESV